MPPDRMIRVILFLSSLFVCLSICLSVCLSVNFNFAITLSLNCKRQGLHIWHAYFTYEALSNDTKVK